MDADFQDQYVAAEQAYSASEFDKADALARPLLGQLEPLPASGAERDATLAWRAFVALLLGHIHLYGKDDVSQSTEFYRLVLASEPPDTLRELAQQGLNEALERSPVVDVAVSAPVAEELASVPFHVASSQPAGNDLIRDPFLNATESHAAADNPEAETIKTAMPWLKAESQQPMGSKQPSQLDSAQEQIENQDLVRSQEAHQQASAPPVSRPFEADPKRLEAGLLRVTLKPIPQRKASSAHTTDDAQSTSLSLQKRLVLAWRSLRRR